MQILTLHVFCKPLINVAVTVPHLLPCQSLPERLVLLAKPFDLLLGLPQLSLQVLQVLFLLLPRLAGRLSVLYHPLLPLQHLHLRTRREEEGGLFHYFEKYNSVQTTSEEVSEGEERKGNERGRIVK